MANFNFNKAILGGRLTADPELRQTPNGIPVLSFTIAVSRRFVRQDPQQPQQAQQPTADFISCVAWRQQAELISKYFRKGSSICVVGNIQVRQWNDQQGNKRYTTEVVVDEVMFVDSKDENPMSRTSSAGGYPDNYATPSYSTTPADSSPSLAPKFEEMSNDDDLPF